MRYVALGLVVTAGLVFGALAARWMLSVPTGDTGLAWQATASATGGMTLASNTSDQRIDGRGRGVGAVRYSKSGHELTTPGPAQIEAMASGLTAEQRRILLEHGTEPAFCGTLHDSKEKGTYCCRLCGLPLFNSGSKFVSGTGWPSFFVPVDKDHISYVRDTSIPGMERIEIRCGRCDSHQGHVFDDGPKPTGLRYCVNEAALEFFADGTDLPARSRPVATETAYFAGGCFWGVEDQFQQIPGVIDAISGYMGGEVADPSYRAVCSGSTGHTETVRVVFDPTKVSYDELLGWFFKVHNPTTLNRQGPDIGTQYRSAIFTASDEQHRAATAFIQAQQRKGKWSDRTIVTEVNRASDGPGAFWAAEEYHQDYHAKHGGSCALPE